jgi:hypothetical protein|tara:strand:+ start:158 stop:535 length:378 start_codon:yes stop_codon:yes gene_type:complete
MAVAREDGRFKKMSAEWIMYDFPKWKISISCSGKQYLVSGKVKAFTGHHVIEIDGEQGYGTTEKRGFLINSYRGDLPLGTEEKFDVVTIEISEMGNITLTCESEVIVLKVSDSFDATISYKSKKD